MRHPKTVSWSATNVENQQQQLRLWTAPIKDSSGRKPRSSDRVRQLRKAKELSERALAEKLGISFTYLCKVESKKLDIETGPFPGLIRDLPTALETDLAGRLLLTKEISSDLRDGVVEKRQGLPKLASLNVASLDEAFDM